MRRLSWCGNCEGHVRAMNAARAERKQGGQGPNQVRVYGGKGDQIQGRETRGGKEAESSRRVDPRENVLSLSFVVYCGRRECISIVRSHGRI